MNTSSSSKRDKNRALLNAASMTAGSDNWKTSAGRLEGPDNFVLGDAWRCIKLQLKSSIKPSVCPVCLEKPGSEADWYVTKSCKHAVCRECLQDYASSLISDSNHSGPLKCPCCPRLLRVQDAMVALDKQQSTVLERWDNKVRDELMRSMGEFKPCPHCSGSGDQSHEHN